MTKIEEKELQGVSIRTLIYIIGATVTLVVSGIGFYSKLSSQVKDVSAKVELVQTEIKTNNDRVILQKEGEKKYDELRMQLLEDRVSVVEKQLQEINKK